MRFGIREICEVVLRAKATQYLGKKKFYKNEPVLYFDTLKTSSLEGASTTVYATGGRGNTRLVAWEGERTLTFTMEDALISPESFAILSGAGLIDVNKQAPIYVHTTSQVEVKQANIIELPEEACWNKYSAEDEFYHNSADIFVMTMTNGQIDSEPCIPYSIDTDHKTLTCYSHAGTIDAGDIVLVDYYVKRTGGAQLIEITADKFGGNYYLEASTLFRDEQSGVDMPAEFIIPNCKVQSNFTFSMAATGDPSTFTFTMDAFPDYTKFDRTHKVLAAIQVITEAIDDVDDKRVACVPQSVTSITDGIYVTFDNDSTEDDCKLTISGSNVDGTKYNREAWDLEGQFSKNNVLAGEIEIVMPIVESGTYRLVTKNPTLKYFKEDPSIKFDDLSGSYVKDKTYTITDGSLNLLTAITNEAGVISIKLFDEKDNLVKTFTIKNEVNFEKAYKVNIENTSSASIEDITVNNVKIDKTLTSFRAVRGDEVCLTMSQENLIVTPSSVTQDGKLLTAKVGTRDITINISDSSISG